MHCKIKINKAKYITDSIAQMSRQPKTYKKRRDPFLMPNDQFKSRYRFKKTTVRKIVEMVKPDIELDTRGCGTSVALQVLVALRCWGRREVRKTGNYNIISSLRIILRFRMFQPISMVLVNLQFPEFVPELLAH